MRRKVIQIAESTQLISLPRKWALSHNIKKGDELNIAEEGNKLVIHTDKNPELGAIEVSIGKLDRDSIMFLLRTLYKNGYDEIKLNFDEVMCENIRIAKKERIVDVITQEVSRLNGVEIFTQKENYCIIKTISEDTIKAFDNILRRMFLLSSEAMTDMIDGYKSGNVSLLETVQVKHDTVTKLVSYCERLLNKVGYREFRKTDVFYHLLETIDIILDLLKYNARDIIANKVKASEQGIKVAESIRESFNLWYDFYYNFNLEKMQMLSKNRYQVMSQIAELQKKIPKNELSVLTNMEQILEYILSLTTARLALNY